MAPTITSWDQLPVMVPLATAARTIGVARSSLYNLMKAGQIQSRRVGGRVFITKAELRRFCEGDSDAA
jgi:excisionase family DNA binding protein